MGTCTDLIGKTPLRLRWSHRIWNAADGPSLPADANQIPRVMKTVCIELSNPLKHWTEAQILSFENPSNENAWTCAHSKPFRYGYFDGQSETNLDPTNFGGSEYQTYMAQEQGYLDVLLALDIVVKVYYLDCERFSAKPWTTAGSDVWNQAIRDHFDAYTAMIRASYTAAAKPQPHINYYGDGAWWPDAGNLGWGRPNWVIPYGGPVDPGPYGDSWGTICYHLPEIDTTRIQLLRGHANRPSLPLYPWLSCGWYKERTREAWSGIAADKAIGDGAMYQFGAILNLPSYYASETTPVGAPRVYRFGGSNVGPPIGGCLYGSPDTSLMIDDLLSFIDGSAA
jgi:hypothetical protein